MITRDRIFYFLIALVFTAALIWIHSVWILLGVAVLMGLLPISKSYFVRYWVVAAIALFVALLIQQPEIRMIEILGAIIPIGSYAYMLATIIITSLAMALPAYTIQQFLYTKRRRR